MTRFGIAGGSLSKESVDAKVIGHVRNDITSGKVDDWDKVVSEIVLEERYSPSLDGIEDFSHIVVVFWMNQVDEYRPKVHPRGREDIPEQGVFATRTPFRPNPIGISAVRLLERKGSILTVSGLDCFDGTPVLDLKPYTPKNMRISNIRIPEWMERLFENGGNP